MIALKISKRCFNRILIVNPSRMLCLISVCLLFNYSLLEGQASMPEPVEGYDYRKPGTEDE